MFRERQVLSLGFKEGELFRWGTRLLATNFLNPKRASTTKVEMSNSMTNLYGDLYGKNDVLNFSNMEEKLNKDEWFVVFKEDESKTEENSETEREN